jgi:hypothetical protein
MLRSAPCTGARVLGSGGRIRTSDLWVMSPTSCHCSTPRQGAVRPAPAPGCWFWSWSWCWWGNWWGTTVGRRPRRPRLPRGRPRSTLRRCGTSRPGSGWDRVGSPRSRPRAPPDRLPPPAPRPAWTAPRPRRPHGLTRHRGPGTGLQALGSGSTRRPAVRRGPHDPAAPTTKELPPSPARTGGRRHRSSLPRPAGTRPLTISVPSAPVGCPPSTWDLPTRSSPGGLSRLSPLGRLVSGRDSHLDAFSGSPIRTWLPSGAGSPTTGAPAVRPSRSSRTRDGPPHTPTACGG